jgi:hypothetical protein
VLWIETPLLEATALWAISRELLTAASAAITPDVGGIVVAQGWPS